MAQPHTKTSGSALTAVVYITLGALMDVWSGLWYVYLHRHQPANDTPYFWCCGFFLTGLTFILIGLALGRIGRAARHAEAPPEFPPPNAPLPVPTTPAQGAIPIAPMPSPVAPVAPLSPVQPVAGNPNAYQPRR